MGIVAVLAGIGSDRREVAVGGMRPRRRTDSVPGFRCCCVTGAIPGCHVVAGIAERAVGAVHYEKISVLRIMRIVTGGALHVAARIHMHAPGRGWRFQLAIRVHQRRVVGERNRVVVG